MGRAADSQPDPQEVLEALPGLMPACWQTLRTRQTANMLKMLRLRRSAVALHCIISLGIGMEGWRNTEEGNELI